MKPKQSVVGRGAGLEYPRNRVLAVGAMWGWFAAAGTVYWDFNALEPVSNSAVDVAVGGVARVNGGTSDELSGQSPSVNYTAASGLTNLQAAAHAGSFSTNDSTWFEVTLTPGAGCVISVTNLAFGMRSTTSGPVAYCVRADTDRYASDLVVGLIATDGEWVLREHAVAFRSAVPGEPVTLRIYGYGGTSSSAGNWRLDDLRMDVEAVESGPGATPPVIAPVLPRVTRVGETLVFALTITATDGDTVTGTNVTALSEVSGVWGLDAGVFCYAPAGSDVGERQFAFTAWDKDGTNTPVTVSVTVRYAQAPAVRMTVPLGIHTQKFDGLSLNGDDNVWDDAAEPLLAWYACLGNMPPKAYKAGKGTETAGALYAYGAEGNPDRALGAIASDGTGDIRFGVAFTNETGCLITNVTVTYAGEQWRCASNDVQSLVFGYCVTNAVIPLAQAVYEWLPALRFDAPHTTGMKAGAVTGEGYTVTASLPVTVPAGGTVILCWEDKNDVGTDHGLAVDDLAVSWAADRTSLALRASVMLLK
ncbi:MAG: hypothetical protein PHV28_03140 [Kiritimatiellae bacterium]|nr:hypothetical protein [Kiritimatiellia bacterium]